MSYLDAVRLPFQRTLPRPTVQRTKKSVVEKRVHPRAAIEAKVTCQRPDGTSFDARATDISMGGMYLETEQRIVFGENLSLELSLSGAHKTMRLPAVVRWTDPRGFGVQFGLLGARETHAISQLIRR
jgi:type IV pilus assembly protein PilZ